MNGTPESRRSVHLRFREFQELQEPASEREMPPEFPIKPNHRLTLDTVSPLKTYVSWGYTTVNLFLLVLFIMKVALMMVNTYSFEHAMHMDTVSALNDCNRAGAKSKAMQEFCARQEERTQQSPLQRTIGKTADRLYWGTLASIQAVLSSTYTLLFVAGLSAVGGFYVSTRGILDFITPKYFRRPCRRQKLFTEEDMMNNVVLSPTAGMRHSIKLE